MKYFKFQGEERGQREITNNLKRLVYTALAEFQKKHAVAKHLYHCALG